MSEEPNKIEWLPILMALGEKELARIFDNSPDIQAAILEAYENADRAIKEADALKKLGHEGE